MGGCIRPAIDPLLIECYGAHVTDWTNTGLSDMQTSHFLDWLSPGAMFGISVVVVLGSIGAGFKVGQFRRLRSKGESESGVGSVVAAMLGLLAFVLAFTFGIAASRFDTRKQLLLDEVNAIQTTVLRSQMMIEPHRTELIKLLRQYVELRAAYVDSRTEAAEIVAESTALQNKMWSHATAIAQRDGNSEVVALFIESLNNVFDLHGARATTTLLYRIPESIWFGLLVVTVFTMATVGFQFGLADRHNFLICGALAITYSAVILLTAQLDSVGKGSLRVNLQPMIELKQHMQSIGM